MNKTILILFTLLLTTTCFGENQNETDSLLTTICKGNKQENQESFILLYKLLQDRYGNEIDDPVNTSKISGNETEFRKLVSQTFEMIGNKYYEESIYDSATKYIDLALQNYQAIQDTIGTIRAWLRKANIAIEEAEFDSATAFNDTAYHLSEMIRNEKLKGKSFVNSGIIYYYSNDYKNAIEKFFETLLIYNKMGDSTGIAFADRYIGIIYNEWGAHQKAIDYYDRAEAICRKMNNERDLSKILTNKADVYNYYLSDYSKAMALYQESLSIKKSLNDVSGIALLNNNIGTVYGNLEDYTKALKYLEKSHDMYKEFNSQVGLIMTEYNIGYVYMAYKKYEKAISMFENSLRKAEAIDYQDYVTANYLALTEATAANCDHKDFKKYFDLYRQTNDSLQDHLNKAQMLEAEAGYRTSQLVNENAGLKDKVYFQDKKIKRNRLFLMGLGAVILILFVVIYIQSKTK